MRHLARNRRALSFRPRYHRGRHPVTMRHMNIPLSAQRIAALSSDVHCRADLELVASTGSTNADLLARLNRLTGPLLLVAEAQTAGRGRAGREWFSAPGSALTFSLAWKFMRPLAGLVGLPLAVGVAIAETLASFGIDAQLKWPNDVLRDGRKLAGILIETATVNDGGQPAIWAVVGVGLNIILPEQLVTKIGVPVAQMSDGIDRDQLMASLWRHLEQALAEFDAAGFDAFMERWNRLHAYAGQMVTIIDRGRTLHEGRAAGVDQSGRLQIDTGAGPVMVVAGDVSLRALKESGNVAVN